MDINTQLINKVSCFFAFLVLMIVLPFYTQAQTVTGKVTDAQTHEGLPGVNVVIKGTTTGTFSDNKGTYSLRVPSEQDTLVFSFVGYQTRQVPINGRTQIHISLNPQAISGQELVVVGYGTQRNQDVTGSVSSITSKQLENASVTTPDEALQGRIAGVSVHKDSHAPGGGISVDVRGTTSLNAGGSPLYVVDGIPLSTGLNTNSGGYLGGGATYNPLNSLDPSDIASIQVLKSASAAAIYGSRGANGVVLITTKKGGNGKNVEFSTSLGVSQISHKLDFMTAKDYAKQANTVATISGNSPVFTQQQVNNFGAGTDWQDATFQNGIQQKYNLSFLGGTDNLQYLVSGNYADNEGIVPNTGLKRYATRVNLNADVSSAFTVGANFTYAITDNNRVTSGSKGYGSEPSLTSSLIVAPPTIPARDSLGNYSVLSNYPLGSGLDSPLAIAEGYKQLTNTNRFIGNIYGNYDLTKHLSAKVRIGSDIRNYRYHNYYPIGSAASGGSHGVASQLSDYTVHFVDNNTLQYERDFANIHHIDLLAGFVFQSQKTETLNASSRNLPSDFYSYNNLGAGSSPQPPGSGASRWNQISYLARLNYSLKEKYLLTASYRVDGNSKFGANNKYGSFPAVAVAWRIGNEDFIKDLDVISHLKIKAGWGKTGNAAIGDYASQALIGRSFSQSGAYIYNGVLQPTTYPNGLSNPDLTWEKVTGENLGLDMGFFNDRLSFSAAYYHKKSTSLLLDVPLPRQSGFGSVLENAGSMLNKGVSFQLSTQNVQKKSFSWSTDLNISHNKNTILSLAGADYIYTGWQGGANIGPHGHNVVRLQPGHSVGAFYGSVYEGIWHSQDEIDKAGTMPSAKPGEIRYKDVNGDGIYDTNDDVFLGNGNPTFNFGITNDFNYKNLSLHVFIYGKYGNKVVDLPEEKFLYSASGVSAERVLTSWTPSTPNNALPGRGSTNVLSNTILDDGSFLRVQNLSLNYDLPIAKWHLGTLDQFQIGVSVDNLAIITNYKGYDPEVNSFGSLTTVRGVDRYGYPPSRTIRFNLKLKF